MLLIATQKKHMTTIAFSTGHLWRLFCSLIVLLFLRTNKPIRMDVLSMFLEDFRGPSKTVFLLKIMHSKRAGNMAHCGPNLNMSKDLFSFLTPRNYCSGKYNIETKSVNQCYGSLRMEDQVIQSRQTFLVKNCFLPTAAIKRVREKNA